jgi:hypothetical protein
MDAAAVRDAKVVVDEAVARFLADGRTGRFLASFLGRERSVAEAAQYHGVAPARMDYWIKRMLVLGLIKPVGKSAGSRTRRQTHYTATAQSFCISRSRIGFALWRELIELFTRHVWGSVVDSVAHSSRYANQACLWVYRDPDTQAFWRVFGGLGSEMSADDGTMLNFGLVYLTPELYRAMQQEVNEVALRYMSLSERDQTKRASCVKTWYVVAVNQMPV